MDDQIKTTIRQMFPQLLQENLMAFSNTVVPQHKHNGVDSPIIPIQNIGITAGVGIPLMNGIYGYNIYIDAVDNSLQFIPNQAVIDASLADLSIGDAGARFNNVNITADQGYQVSVLDESPDVATNVFLMTSTVTNNAISDGINSVTEQLTPTLKRYTASGNFAVQWPNTTLPTAVAGMFAFDAGTFYMCLSNGTWTPVPTVPGLGGTVTSVGVSAPLAATSNPITTAGTISIPKATGAVDGYLSSTDWNTFDSKQPAGTYVTSVSGTASHISSTGGTTPVIDLINTAVTPGSYTYGSFTVDATGRLTAASSGTSPVTSVSSAAADTTLTITPTTGAVTAKINLSNANTWAGSQTFSAQTNFNGTINQNSAYAKFGNAAPFLAVPIGVDIFGNDNTTSGVQAGVGNRNSGTSAYAGFYINNNLAVDGLVDHYAFIGLNSSTYTDTTFGTAFAVANQLNFQNTDGPIAYVTNMTGSTGAHIWYAGGSATTNEVFRITNTQALSSVQIGWATGLGAITHLIGPADQTFAIAAKAPTQLTTTVAGNALSLTASAAVAGSSVAGAAIGGAINITSGAGAFLTSGTATGGAINITTGVGANSAQSGALNIKTGAGSTTAGTGDINIQVGAAGGTSNNALTPGKILITAGDGHTKSSGNDVGATWTARAGKGGDQSAVAGTGSLGGATSILSGVGGNATGASGTRTGGNSGDLTIGSAAAGTGASANGVGGSVFIQTNATTRLTFTDTGVSVVDAYTIAFGTSTGTKLGTATTQKIGFWNAAPIVQPTTAIAAATFVANTSGIANDTATWDGYTIGQIVKALRNAGLLA